MIDWGMLAFWIGFFGALAFFGWVTLKAIIWMIKIVFTRGDKKVKE